MALIQLKLRQESVLLHLEKRLLVLALTQREEVAAASLTHLKRREEVTRQSRNVNFVQRVIRLSQPQRT
jgi:hypothetical protein